MVVDVLDQTLKQTNKRYIRNVQMKINSKKYTHIENNYNLMSLSTINFTNILIKGLKTKANIHFTLTGRCTLSGRIS